jgi:hypothetical protein
MGTKNIKQKLASYCVSYAVLKYQLTSQFYNKQINNSILAFVYYVEVLPRRQPLWSSGQSSWLQIQRSGFCSRRYQIFWEIMGLERGPLSLVNTIEELLGRNNSGSGLEIQEYGRRDPSHRPRDTLYPQKLALTSPTVGCRSAGIVFSRTEVTEMSNAYTINEC